jgi:hypothetical protein
LILFGVINQPVSASSPRAILFYGNGLESPILLKSSGPNDDAPFALLWDPRKSQSLDQRSAATEFVDRPYFDVAIFWATLPEEQLLPRYATQHGRFYPAVGAHPAGMVMTPLNLMSTLNHLAEPSNEVVTPIPTSLSGFSSAWTLNRGQIAVLKSLGVPGI